MCGLWGAYSSALSGSERDNALFLGFLSQTRGSDSTGVATVWRGKKNKFKQRTVKAVDHATGFMHSGQCGKAFENNNPFLIMGHCRAATLGAINERNAHPIEEGPVILCHNGSVSHFLQDKKSETHSDSREIARRFWQKGITQTLKDTNGEPWALTWIDSRSRTFNLARNNGRTLWMIKSRDNTYYWASERWMLQSLALKSTHIFEEPYMVPVHTRIAFELGTTRETRTELELTSPWTNSYLLCHVCKKGKMFCECGKKKEELVTNPFVTAVSKLLEDKRSHIFDKPNKGSSLDEMNKGFVYKGWQGGIVSISKVFDRLRKGCDMCKRPCTPREPTHWIGDDAFVCDDCKKNNPNALMYLKDIVSYESSIHRKV